MSRAMRSIVENVYRSLGIMLLFVGGVAICIIILPSFVSIYIKIWVYSITIFLRRRFQALEESA